MTDAELAMRLSYWCQMCGAAPGDPCTVISGSGEPGDRPGDTRPEPHYYRSSPHKPAVLIPDEPEYALPGARPWGPKGELVNPPAGGDDQRRCWMIFGNTDGTGSQCLLFNGHPGGHQLQPASHLEEELARYGGLIAVARNAHETGQKIHVGLQESCDANATNLHEAMQTAVRLIEEAPFAHPKLTDAQVVLGDAIRVTPSSIGGGDG